MVGVIPLMALAYSRWGKDIHDVKTLTGKRVKVKHLLPYFIIGFLFFAAFRSIGDVSLVARGKAFPGGIRSFL